MTRLHPGKWLNFVRKGGIVWCLWLAKFSVIKSFGLSGRLIPRLQILLSV